MGQQEAGGDGSGQSVGAGVGKALDDGGEIEDQDDTSITQNRGAADQVGRDRVVVQSLDDQFFFSFESVNDQAEFALAGADDEYE